MMTKQDHVWAIVLAAGDGTRLRALTIDRRGRCVPKQFCSLDGGPALLENALRRGRTLAGTERVVTVVAEQHREHWAPLVRSLPRENVIVQPANRGTAAGLLLPLLAILERDPRARVAVLASDHWVEDEETLRAGLAHALEHVRVAAEDVALLGFTPDAPEAEYGWIVPGPGSERLRPIRRFVEKPRPELAAELHAQGALWNGFLLAACGRTLLAAYERRLPRLVAAFRRCGGAYERLYATLEHADFSRDVLQGDETSLRVLEVPPCGWTDLGTPQRVAACLARRRRVREGPRRRLATGLPPVLSHALVERERVRIPRRRAAGAELAPEREPRLLRPLDRPSVFAPGRVRGGEERGGASRASEAPPSIWYG